MVTSRLGSWVQVKLTPSVDRYRAKPSSSTFGAFELSVQDSWIWRLSSAVAVRLLAGSGMVGGEVVALTVAEEAAPDAFVALTR